MFLDPTAVTIDGSPRSFPRVETVEAGSTYRCVLAGATYTLTISHDFSKPRQRVRIALRKDELIQDPLVDQDKQESMTVAATGDFSRLHTPAQVEALGQALMAFLSTPSVMTRVALGES